MPDNGKIPSEEKEGADVNPTRLVSDDEKVLPEDQEGVEGIPANYIILYEICLFEESEEILLFNKRNNKVSISVGLVGNQILPVNCVFNTDSGPNLVREDFRKAEWLKHIQSSSRPALKITTNQKVIMVGTATLHVTKGGLQSESCFRCCMYLSRASPLTEFVPRQVCEGHLPTSTEDGF